MSLRYRSGFTLVELLVVIAVIALLIGILIPALGGARRSANRLKCLANLRSIGQAVELYTNAYAGHYFPTHQPEGTPLSIPDPPHLEWYELLADETGFNLDAMQSPGDPYAGLEIDHGGDLEPMISYSINGYFEVIGNKVDGVRRPASTVTHGLRGDADIEASAAFPEGPIPAGDIHLAFHPWEPLPAHWWDELAVERYGPVANYLFADGHADDMAAGDLTDAMAQPGPSFQAARE